MESYIIRIYRRDGKDPDAATGIMEGSALEGEAAFSNLGEVLDILRKPGAERAVPAKKKLRIRIKRKSGLDALKTPEEL